MDQNSFEFFEDEEDELKINLIEVQRNILNALLTMKDGGQSEDEEGEEELELWDGSRIDKKMLTFKVLLMDQSA